MFKYKPDKHNNQEKITTLDGDHRDTIKSFEKNRKNLDEKKKCLVSAVERLHKLDSTKQSELTFEDIKMKSILKDEICHLKKDINDISNNTTELNYYMKVNDILLNYYDIVDNTDNPKTEIFDPNSITEQSTSSKKTVRKRSRIRPIPQKNILCFFSESNTNAFSEESPIQEDISLSDNDESTDKNIIPKNRTMLYEQYQRTLNVNWAKNLRSMSKFCEKCNIERVLIQSDGTYACPKCGEIENILVESDIPNFKDSTTEKPSYPYKRLNHLIEWLNQFQAREATDIPKEVFDSILQELKRSRVKNFQTLSIIEMKNILKKLKLHQYYEHIPHIISKISGKQPPTLSRETEEEIKYMFKAIQEPFQKYCPKERTNFLSYSYVLHKFFQILRLDAFVVYFPLLKSREKLRLQDKLWKNICDDLGWEFYPSI